MTTNQQRPMPTLSDVMEAVLEKVGPDLVQRGNRMIVDLVDSSTDTERDLSPVADVIAGVLDSASLHSRTKRNFVRVAFADGHVVMTVRDPVPGTGWPLARSLAETYGSRITCCSAETERGSEVVVQLPVPMSKPEPAPALDGHREFRSRATVARPLLWVRAAQEARQRG